MQSDKRGNELFFDQNQGNPNNRNKSNQRTNVFLKIR